MKFSVIVLAYNEENNIRECLKSIKNSAKYMDVEIILSDGGSSDKTVIYANEFNVIVVKSKLGRGIQCNEGAKAATGDILCFLHADSTLPENTFKILNDKFNNENIKIGTFRLGFDKNNWLLNFYTFFTRFDSIFTSFGDQCIVVRKDFFNKIDKFPNWKLFEDVDFLRKARKLTKIYSFPATVRTSARRFLENGLIRQQIRNFFYIMWYLFGASHDNLDKKYNPHKKDTLNSLIIFARYPELGKVKTRLAKNIGKKNALEFYQLCLNNIFKESESVVNAKRCIYISETKDLPGMKNIASKEYEYYSQTGIDLGERMKNAFFERFEKGSEKVVIIGTDVPDISGHLINDAFKSLNENDIVIGPSFDGGYYLLGSKTLHNQLFENISWSTNTVFEQTIAIAKKIGLKIHTLPWLHDIDTEQDLKNWYSKSNRIYADKIIHWYKLKNRNSEKNRSVLQ